ncbi:UNVERIFIED_CONTAM: hypothetical protein K2H54_002565 [Gekko kuhli]
MAGLKQTTLQTLLLFADAPPAPEDPSLPTRPWQQEGSSQEQRVLTAKKEARSTQSHNSISKKPWRSRGPRRMAIGAACKCRSSSAGVWPDLHARWWQQSPALLEACSLGYRRRRGL